MSWSSSTTRNLAGLPHPDIKYKFWHKKCTKSIVYWIHINEYKTRILLVYEVCIRIGSYDPKKVLRKRQQLPKEMERTFFVIIFPGRQGQSLVRSATYL